MVLVSCLKTDAPTSSETSQSSSSQATENSLQVTSSISEAVPLSSAIKGIDESSNNESKFDSSVEVISSSSEELSSSVRVVNSSSSQMYSGSTISEMVETGTFIDERDDQEYGWTKIGDQIWLAKNLNYALDDGSSCYNDSLENCETFGRLYTWTAAMNGETSSVLKPSGVQGVCPDGWHFPSEGEWREFVVLIDGMAHGGAKLKTNGMWSGFSGNNEFRFNAKPSGYKHSNGTFYAVNESATWWTATANGSVLESKIFGLSSHDNDFTWGNIEQTDRYAVRCVKND